MFRWLQNGVEVVRSLWDAVWDKRYERMDGFSIIRSSPDDILTQMRELGAIGGSYDGPSDEERARYHAFVDGRTRGGRSRGFKWRRVNLVTSRDVYDREPGVWARSHPVVRVCSSSEEEVFEKLSSSRASIDISDPGLRERFEAYCEAKVVESGSESGR